MFFRGPPMIPPMSSARLRAPQYVPPNYESIAPRIAAVSTKSKLCKLSSVPPRGLGPVQSVIEKRGNACGINLELTSLPDAVRGVIPGLCMHHQSFVVTQLEPRHETGWAGVGKVKEKEKVHYKVGQIFKGLDLRATWQVLPPAPSPLWKPWKTILQPGSGAARRWMQARVRTWPREIPGTARARLEASQGWRCVDSQHTSFRDRIRDQAKLAMRGLREISVS